ncbi:MAG: hypothetical protein AB9M53_00835 [Leptothrix sp. (in: b-proteobacteria)]
MATRIYLVTSTITPGTDRLIDATSPAQAVRHVARDTLAVEVAGQQDIVRLLTAGTKVERAGADEPATTGSAE